MKTILLLSLLGLLPALARGGDAPPAERPPADADAVERRKRHAEQRARMAEARKRFHEAKTPAERQAARDALRELHRQRREPQRRSGRAGDGPHRAPGATGDAAPPQGAKPSGDGTAPKGRPTSP